MARSNYCSVYGCLNSSRSNPELSYFTLPSQEERKLEFLRLMCREDLKDKPGNSYRICEIHFHPGDVMQRATRKTLGKYAIPALHLPEMRIAHKEIQTEDTTTIERHTQTTKDILEDTAGKRKLREELNECKKKLKILEGTNTIKAARGTFHKLCDKFLGQKLALLVKAQTGLKMHAKGNRYDKDYIIFCLSLYFTSPQAYKFLQSALCLPCASTLYKHSFPITTEINERAMSILKLKVQYMTEAEKNCSVIIGAMTLKRNLFYDNKNDKIIGFHEVEGWQSPEAAKTALVIMVRGIVVQWKQPIAYALLAESYQSEEVTKWIDKVLESLFKIGLQVRAFVSDQGCDIWNDAKSRIMSTDKPYFFINDRKIYYIYDAPHLIRNVRDNFMQYDFHFGNSVAKYEHVQQFYNLDVENSCRLAPKLTNSHINPTNVEKTKVEYATQLLSKSVGEGIFTNIDYFLIEESGRETAKFITTMNDLFDSLNSSTLRPTNEFKRPYTGNESQKTFFKEMLDFFKNLKLVNPNNGLDCTSNAKFMEGFQITITSLQLLFEDLRLEGNNFMFTRRLNKDVLETLFDQIRKNNRLALNPKSSNFEASFKKIYFANIIKPPRRGNCADDLGKLFVQTLHENGESSGAVPKIKKEPSIVDDEEADSKGEISSTDYNKLNMPEKDSLLHICCYLLKLCSEKHEDCKAFERYIRPIKIGSDPDEDSRYSRYRSYHKNDLLTLLVSPCNDFIEYVERMEEIFRRSFKRKHISCKVSVSIYEEMKDIPFSLPCPCFPKAFLIKLFIRMRIFNTLKFNNKNFRALKTNKRFTVAKL